MSALTETVKLSVERIEYLRKEFKEYAYYKNEHPEIDALFDLALAGLRAQWISVEDRLPSKEGMYLALRKGDAPSELCAHIFADGRFIYGDGSDIRFIYGDGSDIIELPVTHWMPLPIAPPSGEGQGEGAASKDDVFGGIAGERPATDLLARPQQPPSRPDEPRVVGWIVFDNASDIEHAALYNLSQKEQAFSAAERWKSCISALVVSPNSRGKVVSSYYLLHAGSA